MFFNPAVHSQGRKMKVLIYRPGAIGDMLMTTHLVRVLASGHNEIDYYGRQSVYDIFANNPFVNKIHLHDEDPVPIQVHAARLKALNDLLDSYDGVVDLEYTIEGRYLWRTDGRYGTDPIIRPDALEWRRKQALNVNYMDSTLNDAGVGFVAGMLPELFLSDDEWDYVMQERDAAKSSGKMRVLWIPCGSTPNKHLAWVPDMIRQALPKHPDVEHYVAGSDQIANYNVFPEDPEVHFVAGKWSLRETLARIPMFDLVIGPESAIPLAAAANFFDTHERNQAKLPGGPPKILFFSHSAPKNISEHWSRTINVLPDPERCPCSPCYTIPLQHYHRKCLMYHPQNPMMPVGFKCALGYDVPKLIELVDTALDKGIFDWNELTPLLVNIPADDRVSASAETPINTMDTAEIETAPETGG